MTQDLPRTRGPLPPAYFLGAIFLGLALDKWFPLMHVLYWPWCWVGVPLLAMGITLALVANRKFRAMGTTVKPFQASSALATDGVYRFTRNPMYTGMIFTLAGEALLLGSLSPWLIIPPYMIVITQLFIKKEEAGLSLQFGEVYDEYRTRVRRWL
jgi:protein-S-isoprenylcysteine O-methyltransferase Ste14